MRNHGNGWYKRHLSDIHKATEPAEKELMDKAEYKIWAAHNTPTGVLGQRQCGSADVDSALFKWFKQAQSINAPISGPIMQTQAELIAAKLGEVDFNASSGWLDRFERRHGIVYKTVCGEAASVDQTVDSDWQNTVLSGPDC
ncbi:tigger transposable element-derived protein 4 [Plakobranchus ocellatus]|uniref:Tigger transposable element-derived protein 4 n=1 Tax=Plakobranchus ocellatus TaxID=259542 RepID=A0AAV4A1Q4_9GAST|nr:tigger transposable element-derived protein 4 [Plakobranchus ocellatus]